MPWARGTAHAAALLCAMSSLASCSMQSRTAINLASDAAPVPLVNVQASIDQGRGIFGNRESGNCVLCHRVAGLDMPFQGDVGPDLTGIGRRLSSAQLRFRIIDASRLNPATVMPAYFRTHGLNRVAEDYRERTVLTAEQVEHLVAYLASLVGSPP